jgi:precorrin-8X/cobalt-precorrin-8 methylmutase
MPEFDSYVIVDWSASNVPVHHWNSIWICTWERRRGQALEPDHLPTRNPHTRSEAVGIVRAFLHRQARASRRTLVGFDFAYGYPRGFASALGLDDAGKPWRQTWQRVAHDLHDSPSNLNNRFGLATQFNQVIGHLPRHLPGPFWGHHPAWPANPQFRMRSPGFPFSAGNGVVLSEFRWSELALQPAHHPHAAWKLFGAGAVGSQVLVGIPAIKELRDDLYLRDESIVWPFEAMDWLARRSHPLVVHAEIWPRLVPGPLPEGICSDERQVRGLVAHLAGLDDDERLLRLFRVPFQLPADVQQDVLEEEGWTLGGGA